MKKTAKRIISLLLTAVLVFGAAPLSGFVGLELPNITSWFASKAEAATSGTCGENLTWNFDSENGVLSISGTGGINSYFSSELSRRPWHSIKNDIKTLVVSEGITRIGSYAFKDCSNLENITLPDTITQIGGSAFSNTAFVENESNWENGVLYICNHIYDVDPDIVTGIYEIKEGTITVTPACFSQCENLTKLVIPESVVYLGYSSNISGFGYCENLNEIIVHPDNKYYYSDEYGVLYNKSKTELIKYPCKNTQQEYEIPSSVTVIYSGSFRDCDNLINISLSQNTIHIYPNAFKYCDSITKIIIPDSVETVSSSTFEGCSNLKELTIGKNVECISDYAFRSCENLTTVYFNAVNCDMYNYSTGIWGVKDYYDVFKGCSNISTVYVSKEVKNVSLRAFSGCGGLENVYYSGNITDWCNINFESNPFASAENLYINNELIEGELIIPNGTTSIGNRAFGGCQKITGLKIPNSVECVGDFSFYDCKGISYITVPNSVKTVGQYSFRTNYQVQINYDGTIADWCSITFNGYTANPRNYAEKIYINGDFVPSELTIPDGVSTIGAYAFYGFSEISSVVFPETLTSIGISAFQNTNITDITIPIGVTSIGSGAFGTDIEKINYGGTRNCWNKLVSQNYILKNADVTVKSYSEIFGWPIANGSDAFGYEEGYDIPISRYIELYGLNIKPLLKSSLTNVFTKWGGNCFGNALLSLGQYFGLVDLSALFNSTEKHLYNFGYKTVTKNSAGEQYYTLSGNKEIIEIFERAMIAQSSKEFSNCEVFSSGSSFHDLVNYFSKDVAEPLLVTFSGDYGSFAHAMILTNDYTKELEDGWYQIMACDSNAPSNNKLTNPTKEYKRGASYLLINPEKSEWKYYADGKIQCSSKKYTFSLKAKTIWFYDISKLSNSFFDKIIDSSALSQNLNLWSYDIATIITAPNIEITNQHNKLLFEMKNGSVDFVADGYNYNYIVDSFEDSSTPKIIFYSNNNDVLSITSDAEHIFAMNDSYSFLFNINSESETVIDFATGTTNVVFLNDSSEKSEVVVQNTAEDFAVKAIINTSDNKNISLNVNNGVVINSNLTSNEITIDVEDIDKSEIIISTTPEEKEYSLSWNVEGIITESKLKEGEEINLPESPEKTGYTFVGWTPIVPKTMPAYDLTFTAVFKKMSDVQNTNVSIRTPSTTTITYGDTITLHAELNTELPEGAYIRWTADNGNFTIVETSADGTSCKVTPESSGDTTFTATVYDADGNVICEDEQTMTAKAGFFQKIIAFFKKLFGLNKDIPNAIKKYL